MATIYSVENGSSGVEYFTTKKAAMAHAREIANADDEAATVSKCEFQLTRATFCDALCRGGWAESSTEIATVEPKGERE